MAAFNPKETGLVVKLPAFLSKDYELVKAIANCGTTIIYQAISTRGRLRGRHVALKKVVQSENTAPSISLLQALCHPNIVALHHIISLDSEDLDYHVLEFCSEGNLLTLVQSRNPPALAEIELRRIIKGISSALIYLKGERVIHGNVCLPNILLGQGFKPKLCDFKHAVLLHLNQNYVSHLSKCATYQAPEGLKSPRRYDFSVDAWSLGCVLHACMGGQADGDFDISIKRFSQLFSNYPSELRNLTLSLLAPNPTERLKVEDIPKYKYLFSSSMVRSHSLPRPWEDKDRPNKQTSMAFSTETFSAGVLGDQGTQALDKEVSSKSTPTACSTSYFGKRNVLRDIGNLPLPRFLQSKESSAPGKSVSCTPTNLSHVAKPTRSISPLRPLVTNRLELFLQPRAPIVPSAADLPIGTTRPLPIDTSCLTPKTHKLAMGTITVMKSQSLLVDFRQNQRRQGHKGDQVILISAQGTPVMVFDAPHLSVPSCLLEPAHQYDLDDLPSMYWKQYNDAANFVDRLRRKIPRIVMYDSGAKCILMSNSPLGDIEIILYGEESGQPNVQNRSSQTDQTAAMRIKYSRQQHFLELAEKITGGRGTEWKKDCKPCLDSRDISTLLLGNEINVLGKKGLKLILNLLQACRHIEASGDVNLESNFYLRGHKPFEETRYLASVGWCKRYSAMDTGNNPKYMLMFFDGTSMLVDPAENFVLYSSPEGNPFKCTLFLPELTQRHPELSKYTRFIPDFVSLYDSKDLRALNQRT